MSDIRNAIIALGTRTTVLTLLVSYMATSYFFITILSVIDIQFSEATNGALLLDRQGFLTPDSILEQVQTYPPETRTILWGFFILDNMLPQLLSFISAILWVRLWTRHPNRIYLWLLSGYWMLLPLGAGISDWMENIFLLPGVMLGAESMTPLTLWGASIFHNVKLGFVGTLGFASITFTVLYIILEARRLALRRPMNAQMPRGSEKQSQNLAERQTEAL